MVSGWFEEREELIRDYSRDACYGQHLSPFGWEVYERNKSSTVAGRYHPPPGDPSAWSIPTGPNCHHSIRAVDAATERDLA